MYLKFLLLDYKFGVGSCILLMSNVLEKKWRGEKIEIL